MTHAEELGPLQHLVGSWEGDRGIDVSYHHADKDVVETPYREKTTFASFGPVDNGDQSLFGLDYRMAAWRGDEEDPFHTEVGYWLWDAAALQVMRAFMIPRGTVVLAGGLAAASDTSFSLAADAGSETYGILSNLYLDGAAKTVRYTAEISVAPDEWSYSEDSVLRMTEFEDLYHHTDRNTLRRVG